MRLGDELAPLEIPVTRTLIVAGAIASRDYQDVHHDAAAAREKGSPDIFMNILTTNGLVGRYITDHFGPGCRLRKVAIRLGAPNYPGDTMVLTGTVSALDGDDAEVRITGTNGIGRHVTGSVAVTVPGAGRATGGEKDRGAEKATEAPEATGAEQGSGAEQATGAKQGSGVEQAAHAEGATQAERGAVAEGGGGARSEPGAASGSGVAA